MKTNQKMHIIFVLILGILFIAQPVFAFVNTGWDWHLVNGEKKRTLHYCAGEASQFSEEGRTVDVENFTPGLPGNWAVWLTEAVENWNNADTGWTFEASESSTIPPCQVLILLADISEGTHGGGVATPQDTNGDGQADLTRIVIDSNLEETKENGEDQTDGQDDGWSREGDEMTRDPVGTLMHELSHALRTDHHQDSKHSDSSDEDITDPRKPGDHNTDLSNEDKREAAEASGSEAAMKRFALCPNPYDLLFENVRFLVPESAFYLGALMDVNILDGVAIPEVLALPGDFSHMLGSGTIYFRTNQPLRKPIQVSIPYTKEELKGGDNMYVGDMHDFIPPALDEDTLAVFKYVMEPFGVLSEGHSHWELIEGSVLDKENQNVTFKTQETGIFGISAKPLPGQDLNKYGGLSTKAAKGAGLPAWVYIVIIAGAVVVVAVIVVVVKKKK